jgi:hypothetical protein
VRVSGQSGSLVPSASTTLDIVMPENVRARMAQERFWLSVDAGRTGDLTSNRFEVPPAGIKELEITSLGEWMAETGDRIRLTLPVRNSNTIPVKASRITLLSGNLPVGGCDTGVTLQSGSTPSPLTCVMSTRESRGAFDLPNLSVRLEQADGRPLSRVSELKPLPRQPLIIESSTVDAAAKPPQIRVTVRNNGDVYTLLKGAKIANSGQEEGIEWTPQGGPIVVAARSALVLQPIPVSVEDQRKVLLDQQTTMVLNDLGSVTSPLTANLTPLQTSPIEVGSDSRWNEETGELEMILRNRGPIVQTPQGVELILAACRT